MDVLTFYNGRLPIATLTHVQYMHVHISHICVLKLQSVLHIFHGKKPGHPLRFTLNALKKFVNYMIILG